VGHLVFFSDYCARIRFRFGVQDTSNLLTQIFANTDSAPDRVPLSEEEKEMSDRNGQEIIEWYSMAQGAVHDAMAHVTGIKSLARIGLSKTTGLNIAAKWLDDLDLSNDDMRAIVGGGAGGVLGSADAGGLVVLAGLSGPLTPAVVVIGGVAGGIIGDSLGENSDEMYDFARSRILDYFEVDNPKNMVPIGRVSSASLPGQYGVVEAGHELNALDVIAEQRAFQPPPGSSLTSSNPLSDFLGGLGSWLPGDDRNSIAAPPFGASMSVPSGSPGYAPSAAQRSRALSRAASESSRFLRRAEKPNDPDGPRGRFFYARRLAWRSSTFRFPAVWRRR
jgi:hypothetical protein